MNETPKRPSRPGRKLRASSDHRDTTAEAHRRAAVILEVLAGVRTASEAAGLLKTSVNYYYLLERQAIAGLVAACQPQPKGQRPDHQRQLAALEQALERSRRDCQRQAALVRATQRAVGLPATPAADAAKNGTASRGTKGRRRRTTSVRALRLARRQSEKAVAKNEAQAIEPKDAATGDKSLSVQEDPRP